ncbi:MAG TPA: SLC13 family permease [Vicinamibacterales bacterium]|nr:SLC13 family permease [Vicinamibacterales bacterium]
MTQDQIVVLAILAATVAMFLWGRWRHDMVAVASLLMCVAAGLVTGAAAFAGFGHPAVITVACVLILSQGLQQTGAVDVLVHRVLPGAAGPTLSIAALTGLGAVLSAFMNNVGAMALLMPVAIQLAARQGLPPGKVLMPVAFGTILGGMTTLIGTPPNLIVSGFRSNNGGESFAMFDFTPAGAAIAAAGVFFVALVGWRIVPTRATAAGGTFDTGTYLTEVRVVEGSKAEDKTLREIGSALDKADAQVVGMVRYDLRVAAPNPGRRLRVGDILVIEAEPESLGNLLTGLGLRLEEDVRREAEQAADKADKPDAPANDTAVVATAGPPGDDPSAQSDEAPARKSGGGDSGDVALVEMAVRPDSTLIGRSATGIQLRTRFGINLLAVSRQGRQSISRLRSMSIQAGDVLLLQGPPDAISTFASEFGCVPLAARAIRIPDKGRAAIATAVMAAAVGGAALGLLPAAISFAAGVLVFMALRIVSPRSIYDAVDWPVIVLLGALFPVAGAMASTGAADQLARLMLAAMGTPDPVVSLAVVLIATMMLSDFINNAATAAVMCPIAISTASQLGASSDTFLMAVATGASCAFLTPIGHQNNTLILGPGGFRFGDYWRLGVPLEIIVVIVGVPMLMWVWPL